MVPLETRPVMVTSSPVRMRLCDDSPLVGLGNHWLHSMHSSSSTLSRPSVSSWSSRTRTRTPSLKAMNMSMALQLGQAYMVSDRAHAAVDMNGSDRGRHGTDRGIRALRPHPGQPVPAVE